MGKFIAYRHTGADPERLEVLLPNVRDSIEQRGEEVYCTYFDEAQFKSSGMSAKAIMNHAFSEIVKLNGLFVILDTPEKSEGQILEVGFCIARAISIVVAKRKGMDGTYIPDMANYSFEYESDAELREAILSMPKGI